MREFFYNLDRLIYARTGPFSDIIFSFPFLLVAVLIYWLVRRKKHSQSYGYQFKTIRKISLLNEIIRLLLFCWLVEVIYLTLTPTEFWYGVWENIISGQYLNFHIWRFSFSKPDLIPTIIDYALMGHLDWMIRSARDFVLHYIVNVALFVPLGLALPFVAKKVSCLKTAVIGALFSLSIEFLQCFIGRDSSIEDLICNTLGALVGYIMYMLIKKLFPKFTEKAMITTDKVSLDLAKYGND